MTVLVRPKILAEGRQTYGPLAGQGLSPRATVHGRPKMSSQLSSAELAFRIFAAFRAHPHVSNVLTHISRANWTQVESALNAILDPATASDGLSSLARNIVELMCAERGITGKILKPYFQSTVLRLLERARAERLIRHVEGLFLDLEREAEPPAATSERPRGGDQP
jgi:hypothetical protein